MSFILKYNIKIFFENDCFKNLSLENKTIEAKTNYIITNGLNWTIQKKIESECKIYFDLLKEIDETKIINYFKNKENRINPEEDYSIEYNYEKII